MNSSYCSSIFGQLSLRFAIDCDPQKAAVALNCIRCMIANGHNPTLDEPTGMHIVLCARHYVIDEKVRDYFLAVRPFFAVNRMLEDEVMFIGALYGLDVRTITQWAEIMELCDEVDKLPVFRGDNILTAPIEELATQPENTSSETPTNEDNHNHIDVAINTRTPHTPNQSRNVYRSYASVVMSATA